MAEFSGTTAPGTGIYCMVFVGTANYYNFMDGINGIAGITGLLGFALLAAYVNLIRRIGCGKGFGSVPVTRLPGISAAQHAQSQSVHGRYREHSAGQRVCRTDLAGGGKLQTEETNGKEIGVRNA